MMLALHEDVKRESAFGPIAGLPNARVRTFTQPPCDEAKQQGWVVIRMETNRKRIFGFDTSR